MDSIIKKHIEPSEYRYVLLGKGYEEYTILSITAEEKGGGYSLELNKK
jgi:hypothetical protein